MDERVRVQAGQSLLIGFEQRLFALRRGLIAARVELAVVGEEADNSRDVLFPHVVTVLERQVADRFPVGHFTDKGLDAFRRHRCLLFPVR